MAVIQDPFSGLLDGVLQGHAIAQQLRHQAMQEEAYQRQLKRDDQERQLQDIDAQMKIGAAGRPVVGNMVDESFDASRPSGVPGVPGSSETVKYTRPADKSRLLTYKTADGRTVQAEAYTPEESFQRQLDRAKETKHAGSTLVNTPEHLRALGLPAQIYVPDEHLYQYADTTGQLAPVDTPQLYQEMGGPAKVPYRSLPGVTSAVSSTLNRNAADKRATDAEAGRQKRAVAAEEGKNQRATDANVARLKAASLRGAPTAGQAALQGRFNQREIDAKDKEMQSLQALEDKAHGERERIGVLLSDPKLGAADRSKATAEMKSLRFQVQAYQVRKAGIAGATAPPKDIQDKIPEGQEATGPDGRTWSKKDGIVYFVK